MDRSVAVIGLGNMGTVLARILLEHGYEVTVWNRTAAKARPLAEMGARVAADPARAVAAAPLTVVCIERYQQVTDVLAQAGGQQALDGRTIVNLTWGDAEEARSMDQWVIDQGARYLDGITLGYPSEMGTPASLVVYSGAREVYDAHEKVLSALGSSRYTGSNPGMANVLASASAAFHNIALAGFYEGLAYADGFGLEPRRIFEILDEVSLERCRSAFRRGIGHIEGNDYTTDQASIYIHYDVAPMGRAEMRRIGQQARLLSAFCDMVEPALAAGKAKLAPAAMYEDLRSDR